MSERQDEMRADAVAAIADDAKAFEFHWLVAASYRCQQEWQGGATAEQWWPVNEEVFHAMIHEAFAAALSAARAQGAAEATRRLAVADGAHVHSGRAMHGHRRGRGRNPRARPRGREVSRRRDIKFKGWDWTELLAVWPQTKRIKWPKDTTADPFATEEAQGAWLNERIAEFYGSATAGVKMPWEFKQLRRYALSCAKASPHTSQRIMLAIASDPDDFAFLSWLGDIRVWWS